MLRELLKSFAIGALAIFGGAAVIWLIIVTKGKILIPGFIVIMCLLTGIKIRAVWHEAHRNDVKK